MNPWRLCAALSFLLLLSACDSRRDDQVADDWDAYLCKVDDAPASIFLNLGLASRAPLAGADTLYVTRIEMVDPADHGMGSAGEADVLYGAEDVIQDAVASLGLRQLGHVRNRGTWQIAFMGPSGCEDTLTQEVRLALRDSGHDFDNVVKPDPEWSYYRGFLYPDAERMRWIQDRRVVDQLESHGDPLTKRRRVDHWVYFSRSADRTAFAAAARTLGFECDETETDTEERPHGLQVHRVDSVELEAIHDVVMTLLRLAAEHGGEYDGWETSVQR